MRMYAFYCGGEEADMAAFDPFDPAVGSTIKIPWFFYLIDHPSEGYVLFDSGAHPALATNPRERLGAMADSWTITMKPEDAVIERLATLELTPHSIGHVIESHLHYDHAGGVSFFPEAEVYVQKGELPFAHWPPVYQRGAYVKDDFDHDIKWREVDGEFDLFDDGKIVMLPTPGHTPGHQSLLVRLESGPVILLGDAAYGLGKMRERRLPAVLWNPDSLIASWEYLERLEQRIGARLIATHELNYQDVKLAPGEWYE
jgi:glyoxylase-like metal-dependent hydrolase (beta-lactamase superfamily II)